MDKLIESVNKYSKIFSLYLSEYKIDYTNFTKYVDDKEIIFEKVDILK